jgi:endonuclease III
MTDYFGCSKCRYAANGCKRCRDPSFRSRISPSDKQELRETARASRQLASTTPRRARARQQRRTEGLATGQQQRDLLLHRLRRQLRGHDERSAHEQGPQKRTASPTTAAASQPPPSKYRKVEKVPAQASTQAGANNIHLHQQHVENARFGNAAAAADQASQSPESMDVEEDVLLPQPLATNAAAGQTPNGERNATAHAADTDTTGKKRDFIELLESNMAQRREARRSGEATSPTELSGLPAAKRRRPMPASPHRQQRAGNLRRAVWEPPVSPYGLIEEELYDDPWKLLTACLLLNKTSGRQVRRVIWELFELCPSPQAAVDMETQRIQTLIQPLGLFRKRAIAFQKMSGEYLQMNWKDPSELHGIGKYASDAYWIFCRGAWRPGEVDPEDKDLKKYLSWLRGTGGLGTGLQRPGHVS